MKRRSPLFIAGLCLFSFACSAGEPSAPRASGDAAPPAAATANPAIPGDADTKAKDDLAAEHDAPNVAATMCSADEQVVFSCPLAKGIKIASVCASPRKAGAEPTFHYAFGHAGTPELQFPASGNADNAAFSRTYLGFGGNTGGYAYSFANAGIKYIVYSISGEAASHEGGVIVQPSDTSKPATKLACRSTAITETSDDSLIDATLRLKKDPQIQSSGLPETR